MPANRKLLSIFIDETDRWKDARLFEAIVNTLERNGVAGATVVHGSMGFGVHRRVHRRGLFGVTDEKPVVILSVDEEETLRGVLPVLAPMVKEGLITLQDVEVVFESEPATETAR